MHDNSLDEGSFSVPPLDDIGYEGEITLPTNPQELRQLQLKLARRHSGIDTLREQSPAWLMVEAIFDAFIYARPSYHSDGTVRQSRTSAAEQIALETFPIEIYISYEALRFARRRARAALEYGSDRIKHLRISLGR